MWVGGFVGGGLAVKWVGVGWVGLVGKLKVFQVVGRLMSAVSSQLSCSSASMTSSSLCVGL